MTRLYHSDDLFADQVLILTEGQNHYLRHVLRAKLGDRLGVFNERDGEWSAVLTTLSKTNSAMTIESQVRPAVGVPEVSLFFAPLKHDPLIFLMEKATELGVRHFHPVMTERCNVSRVNPERLTAATIDAAQQCERFDIPKLYPLLPLNKALSSWDSHIPLFVCQERGEVPSIREALSSLPVKAPVGFFVGPEGGFSSQEICYLNSFSFTKFISLGPRILRAETAALAVLVSYQTVVGDWV